ncbi:MAG: glycosyltransferase family 39 protein, partial [Thermoguttaceae bacterium]|nr:glycosyltransferase family 39 protein [Thermoguttaceae bacterium]
MSAGLSCMPRVAIGTDVLDRRQANRWIAGLIALGIAVRLVRFALRFPLWYDEAALSANFLDRGYLDFLRPLECGQAAPILFLWVQTTLVRLLGFTEYSLRLFSLATGIASLLVFRRLAGRLLEGSALVLAVGILAVSYPAIRYSAEGKPYGSDLFVSVVLLALAVEWMARPERTGLLWGLAAVAPWCIGLSFPAAFVGGGVSLATGWVLWRTGSRRGWAPWAVYNLRLIA